jgi:integral membrane sensor domain MASE1
MSALTPMSGFPVERVRHPASGWLATAAAIATGNTCEALLAAWLCRRWLPQERPPFQRVEEVFRFAVVAGLASMIAATVGTASAALGGGETWPQVLADWGTWWLGDVAGRWSWFRWCWPTRDPSPRHGAAPGGPN